MTPATVSTNSSETLCILVVARRHHDAQLAGVGRPGRARERSARSVEAQPFRQRRPARQARRQGQAPAFLVREGAGRDREGELLVLARLLVGQRRPHDRRVLTPANVLPFVSATVSQTKGSEIAAAIA